MGESRLCVAIDSAFRAVRKTADVVVHDGPCGVVGKY
ncbi:predicted protein [Plenodomus lingam JN3]|uniref:Uncharacterized protein n=1 Tax=Leptosphaeria maculans (strain JN3 / isolate v23.1.3 / race Av1-4-5-6-7-8) TaxID=985895 RepID=E5A7K1_LEPMJ|nr:predicted protein [Plenodomus lingam JN3]CBX99596.1 predicted protein [Plenodomus lingam JN3]